MPPSPEATSGGGCPALENVKLPVVGLVRRRVLERDGQALARGLEQRHVVVAELARLEGADVQDAQYALLDHQRNAEERLNAAVAHQRADDLDRARVLDDPRRAPL